VKRSFQVRFKKGVSVAQVGKRLGSSDDLALEVKHTTYADRPGPGLKWSVLCGERVPVKLSSTKQNGSRR